MLRTEQRRYLLDNYTYDIETGTLTRKVDVNKYRAGTVVAGYLRRDGYRGIRIQGRNELYHRVVWLMQTGELPTHIDHINGDTTDNRWSNLRIATNQTNLRNSKGWARDLPKGVHLAGKKYVAKIRVDGKLLHLGTHNSPEEAHAAYREAADTYFGEYANYGNKET